MHSFFSSFFSSFRPSLRWLGRQPAFAAVAIAALGLGLGAGTAIFSVVDTVLLRPLPYPEADRLVVLLRGRKDGGLGTSHSQPDLMDLRQRNRVFENLVAVASGDAILTGVGHPRQLRGAAVTEGLLALLRLTPTVGRDLVSADFAPGAPKVVLISPGLWRDAFAADPRVIGRSIALDGEAVTALALSLVTGLAAGLVPAFQAARQDVHAGLGEGARSGADGGRRLRSGLVVAEIAASLVLLVGAGLLVRSFRQLLAVDPGFDPAGVAAFEMTLPKSRYPDKDAVQRAYERTMEVLEALPQVAAAGSTLNLPYSDSSIFVDLWPVGTPMPLVAEAPSASFHVVTEGYFRSMGMRLVEGRTFGPHDDGEPRTVVINRSFAERHWPGRDAVGQRVMINLFPTTTEKEAYEVIGIVGDVRQQGLDRAPAPEMYLPQRQWGARFQYVVLRARGDVAALQAPVRRALERLDPDLPVQLRPLTDYIGSSLVERRFVMLLLSLLGGLALLLAATGIYGVMAYTVSLRRREMSIRMALGAYSRQILADVMTHALALTGLGVVLGLGGAFALSRFLQRLLFRVTPSDPATYVALAALLGGVALVACLGPARRATRVDPMVVLREE